LEAARGKSDASEGAGTGRSFWSEEELQQQGALRGSTPRAAGKSNLGPSAGPSTEKLAGVKPRPQSLPEADNTFNRSMQVHPCWLHDLTVSACVILSFISHLLVV